MIFKRVVDVESPPSVAHDQVYEVLFPLLKHESEYRLRRCPTIVTLPGMTRYLNFALEVFLDRIPILENSTYPSSTQFIRAFLSAMTSPAGMEALITQYKSCICCSHVFTYVHPQSCSTQQIVDGLSADNSRTFMEVMSSCSECMSLPAGYNGPELGSLDAALLMKYSQVVALSGEITDAFQCLSQVSQTDAGLHGHTRQAYP